MFGRITYLTTVAVRNAIEIPMQNKTVWKEISHDIDDASKIKRS
tara:strand:+ start:381 stop:512 length:132 start_codon:yes stop_codon:yes gene_type:complete